MCVCVCVCHVSTEVYYIYVAFMQVLPANRFGIKYKVHVSVMRSHYDQFCSGMKWQTRVCNFVEESLELRRNSHDVDGLKQFKMHQ